MRTRSPIAKCSSSAVVLSMTTSSAARGGAPAMIRRGLRSASSDQLKPSAGGPLTPAGLPSLPMIWAVPNTEPSAVRTPSTAPDRRQQRRRDGLAVGLGDRLHAAHLDGGPRVGGLEDAVEGLVDRVPEDEGPHHEADPEHDRERGQEEPELAGEQVPDGLPEDHVLGPAPMVFMRSRIDSGVGSSISPTIRPSAEEQHPVRLARGGRLVRDHDDGLAELVRGAAHERRAAPPTTGSRAARSARPRRRCPGATPAPGRRRPAAAARPRARRAGASGARAG